MVWHMYRRLIEKQTPVNRQLQTEVWSLGHGHWEGGVLIELFPTHKLFIMKQ